MKANEAPEKIILSADRDTQIIYDEWVINDYTDNIKIEYTRTDAFIEKAVEWLRSNTLGYVDVSMDFEDMKLDKKFFKDFKNYMKGE